MPASFTIDANPQFAAGSTLQVYLRRHFTENGGPFSAAVTSATVSSNSAATFTGLEYATNYWAAQQQSGVWVKKAFRTDDSPTTNDTIVQVISEAPINVQYPEFGAVADGSTDDTPAVAAALTHANSASGGRVHMPYGTYRLSEMDFASKNQVQVFGDGIQATTINPTATTGNVFDLTGASFCVVSDMSIACPTERTAGALFYLDAGAGSSQRNEFRRMRIAGGYRAFHLNNTSTLTLDEIQFTDYSSAHELHSLIHLSGTCTSSTFSNIRGGSGATVANALLYIDGPGVDTVHFLNWDVLNLSPSTAMRCVWVAAGEWIEFTNCSFEGGSERGAYVSGGKGIGFTGCHFLGLHGIEIAGGTSVRLIGGEVVACQRHGVLLAGGTHHEVIGMTISDVSQETTGTYDGINVAPGVTDFTIVDNHIGKMLLGGANNAAAGIIVQGGASNRYVIARNRIATTGVVTPMSDGGTGADKVVRDNVWTGSDFATVASAAALTLPVNAETVYVTGTTNITSITASGAGRKVTLIFAGVLTVTDGSNLALAGNFVTSADDSITLVCNGTNWYEIGRSVN